MNIEKLINNLMKICIDDRLNFDATVEVDETKTTLKIRLWTNEVSD